MNSIFVRIYGGMVAACCVTGIIFYLSLQATNHFRLQHFYTQLTYGPLKLIASKIAERELGDQPGQRQYWVDYLNVLLGKNIVLGDAALFELTDSEKRRLNNQKLVLRVNTSRVKSLAILGVPDNPDTYISIHGEGITEQYARGLAVLLVDAFSDLEIQHWDAFLAELSHSFSFPIKRLPPHQVSLSERDHHRLFTSRKPVVQFDDLKGGASIVAMQLLPRTGEVLVVGPQQSFNWYPMELVGSMLIVAWALVGLAAYLLVKPLEKRLSRMERAVLRVRGGDLSARASVDGNDAVGQLATTFNSMTEHIQRLISAQKELLRAVSHELRTPVARIRFGLEMLVDEEDEVRRESNFEAIDADIEQLDQLIDEIITYSKLEEGTPVLDFTMIDLDALLSQIERESNALGKSIKIVYESPDLPEEKRLVEGEERYIHRAIQNFVGNALRYASSEVVIRYTVIGDVFRVDVEDDGPGIPEEERKRIFQPFARLDDSRTRVSGGYGLGLSIVSRIAFWHGGKVKVSDSPSGGAQFSFMWPKRQSLRETI